MKKSLILTLLLAAAPQLPAGEGHAHGEVPGGQAAHTGPVQLPPAAVQNLGLQTTEAEIREISDSIEIPGRIRLLPENIARVSPPFAGRITKVFVQAGDKVAADAPLAIVEPLALGAGTRTLTAPIAGTVLAQHAVLGQACSPETTLVELADLTEVMAEGAVFQGPVLAELKVGGKVSMRCDVFPGRQFDGVIRRLGTGIDEETQTFHLQVALPNPGDELKLNYHVRLTLLRGESRPAICVPFKAVLGDFGKQFVFVQSAPGTYERREVVTGIRSADWTEIIEGVLPGDPVVTAGNYQLQFASAAAAPSDDHGHAH